MADVIASPVEEAIDTMVVYAAPGREQVIALKVAPGATIGDVVRDSGVLIGNPEFVLEQCKIGVWGKLKNASAPVHRNDRIEIYRFLLADPNTSRLARAAKKDSAIALRKSSLAEDLRASRKKTG